MADERRQSRRTRYLAEVELDGLLKARISNLSADGAFIDCRTTLPPGAVVHLRFTADGHLVETAAEVRYSCPGIGMGVRFTSLSAAARTELARVLGLDHSPV
ncbi:MAG: PilZ domain-containing protein [Acidobacteria bacterium]|nr:PilZ domain-containing protein [Acidobacteriota bacterium]